MGKFVWWRHACVETRWRSCPSYNKDLLIFLPQSPLESFWLQPTVTGKFTDCKSLFVFLFHNLFSERALVFSQLHTLRPVQRSLSLLSNENILGISICVRVLLLCFLFYAHVFIFIIFINILAFQWLCLVMFSFSFCSFPCHVYYLLLFPQT